MTDRNWQIQKLIRKALYHSERKQKALLKRRMRAYKHHDKQIDECIRKLEEDYGFTPEEAENVPLPD